MSNVPAPYEFLLLTLAAFRIFRLLSEDKILDRPRNWILVRTPETLETWLMCAWCQGLWTVGIGWAAWLAWPHAVTLLAVPWAGSAVVGLIKHNLDSENVNTNVFTP